MPTRIRFVLSLVVLLLAIALSVLVFSVEDESPPTEGSNFAGSIRPSGIPPTHLTLRDQHGRYLSVENLRGRPVVISFMYTTCEDDCPILTQQIRGALDELGHDPPVIAVSVDPANDTPARARRFIARQHMTGRMRFLLGSNEELQPIWRAFGIAPQRDGREHSAYVILLDSTGRQRIGFPKDQLTPERLAHDVLLLERESKQQQ